MFVYRENYYIQNEEPKRNLQETDEKFNTRYEHWVQRERETRNLGEVIVGKNRHGTTGTVKLCWLGEFARFTDLAQEDRLPEQRG